MTTPSNKDLYELQDKIYRKVDQLEDKIDSRFVTKAEFELYKKLIQALLFAFISSLVGAFVYLIQKSKGL